MEVQILSWAFEDFKEVLIAIYGGYSLVVKLRSVKAAMRVRFPLVTHERSERCVAGIEGNDTMSLPGIFHKKIDYLYFICIEY